MRGQWKLATGMSFLVIGSLFTGSGCRKETSGGVPLTQVDFQINVNNPAYNDLAVPGGWLYLTGGSLGIIVYRKSMEEFVALDRHCPYQPAELCRVHVDDTEVIARDTTCCGSAFLIMDGSVTQGPASLGLQRYNTSFNGSILRIYN
jgi:nitrite reductase/ring-hydroxylating ferredoxin subunit